jgi:hypothetical protein
MTEGLHFKEVLKKGKLRPQGQWAGKLSPGVLTPGWHASQEAFCPERASDLGALNTRKSSGLVGQMLGRTELAFTRVH